MGVRSATRTESAGPTSGDRVLVAPLGDGLLVVVADGAGPASVGARAADAVLDATRAVLSAGALDAARLLAAVDRALAGSGAYTTAVVAHVTPVEIRGASAGDSAAWLVGPGGARDLTRDQGRTLLGAGATPAAFQAALGAGDTVVVATDGLFKYARAADIARVARTTDVEAAAGGLVELVRLRSGALPDDVTVAIARAIP